MVPVQKLWQAPYFWAGCKAYDFLAGSEGIESSYFLTKSKAIDAFPMLKRENVVGAMVYYGELKTLNLLSWFSGKVTDWSKMARTTIPG
jgi:glycerol-3-phosphate dehydrogenase